MDHDHLYEERINKTIDKAKPSNYQTLLSLHSSATLQMSLPAMNMETPPTILCKKQKRTVSRFKEVLPQVLAMSAANCLVLNMAVVFFLSTLIIADLHNTDNEMAMDDTQASWFGGLPYMCQPIGSIASGFLVTWLGRKRSLMLITIPYLLSCVLMSTAPSIAVLFFTNVIIGITVGLTEAPVNNYFGEVCQPELRSILAGSAAVFYQFGMFLEFLLGSLMHWRTTAAISTVIPITTFLLMRQVPESPIWLIAQDRKKDAEAALCWLRGWVDPSVVQQELEELVSYHDTTTLMSDVTRPKYKENIENNTDNEMKFLNIRETGKTPEYMSLLPHNFENTPNDHSTTKQTTDKTLETAFRMEFDTEIKTNVTNPIDIAENNSGLLAKAKLFLEPETLRPLILTLLLFIFTGMGGMFSIKPFIVEVLHRFHAPIEAKWSSVVVAVAGVLGSIFLIATVRWLGKRKLALVSTAVCAASCLVLGLYAYFIIEPASSTGDDSYLVATWIPLAMFILLSFASIIQCQLPWLLVAEAFPFRTRGPASGLAASFMYLVAFVASKTYLSTEKTFELYGTFWFFCVINFVCFIYLFFQMPETEGKSLQEIERLFAGNKLRNN